MKIKRIEPPKFRVGKFILNELEVRQLQLDVAKKLVTFTNIKVKDINNNTTHIILENGRFDKAPKSFANSFNMVMELLDIESQTNNNE